MRAPDSPGQPGGPESAPHRASRSPRVAAFGRLTDLTRFGGSQVNDSGAGNLGNLT